MMEAASLLLAEADPHPEVFDLLAAALRRLDDAESPVQAVLAFFQWRLLRHVGLLGEMSRCVACGAEAAGRGVYFTSQEGGLLCRACESSRTEKRAVGSAALAGLAALHATDRGQKVSLSEPQAAAVNDLLAYHIGYQLGKMPKMLRYAIPGA